MTPPSKSAKHWFRFGTRRGLTAVELLVATALSAMLMVGILGLLSTLQVQSRELIQKAQSEPWIQRLSQHLRRDLMNTRQVTASRDRLVLRGYLGTDAISDQGTLEAAEVTYHVVVLDDISYLLRDERLLAVNAVSPRRRQVVASEVAGIRLRLPDASDTDDRYTGPVPEICDIMILGPTSPPPLAIVHWCQGSP